MKKITVLLMLLALSFTNIAVAENDKNDEKQGVVYVNVNGLVCDFCARALEKVFAKQDDVENIDVNLDEKVITINFKQGKSLADEKIKQLILDSGYNVESIQHGK